MKTIAIIPARYASTRFPGKPLAILGGKPVIQRVYEQVTTVRVFSTAGRLLQQYTVTNESTFLMPAQTESGFYMVEVMTENDKTTLRYIVK